MTLAHLSDITESQHVITWLDVSSEVPVFADKRYCSKRNNRFLRDKQSLDRIMHKATRNRPPPLSQGFIDTVPAW